MLEAVEAIIKELDEGRAAMRAVIPQFDRERQIYPGWTIKHMLAHITGWDEAARTSLEAHLRHDEAMIPAYRGINEYNEESVRTRASYPMNWYCASSNWNATVSRHCSLRWTRNAGKRICFCRGVGTRPLSI
ncbi:MAG: maleylpyruvate isomerase N-terminal domain-containing protein [Chloroflexi bacterium]|nr:maleylpyruvate isomerase N-terminal domain-containing protein [Chloroflexota bacterium]